MFKNKINRSFEKGKQTMRTTTFFFLFRKKFPYHQSVLVTKPSSILFFCWKKRKSQEWMTRCLDTSMEGQTRLLRWQNKRIQCLFSSQRRAKCLTGHDRGALFLPSFPTEQEATYSLLKMQKKKVPLRPMITAQGTKKRNIDRVSTTTEKRN